MKVVIAYVRSATQRIMTWYDYELRNLDRTLADARSRDEIFEKAAIEYRLRQKREFGRKTDASLQYILENWNIFITQKPHTRVQAAYQTVCSVLKVLRIEELTKWVEAQPRDQYSGIIEEVKELKKEDLDDYIVELASILELDPKARTNLRRLGLIRF